jgi:hypothetical protein
VSRDVAWKVRQRAKNRCEYCHLPAEIYPLPFHLDHVVARPHGGRAVLENLALACLHCNRHKGPNAAGSDSTTGSPSRLFHPRQDVWHEHFEWIGPLLNGKTPIGRITIQLLGINDPDFLVMRTALLDEDAFPLE